MPDSIYVKRSPARICWHILFNNQLIETRDTRKAAESRGRELATQVNLRYAGVVWKS